MGPRGDPGRYRAFTLIELLVVVAIISLLMALLLPSLRHVRGLAQVAQCAQNLHQVSVAGGMYRLNNAMAEPFWRFDNASGDYPHESGHRWQPGTPARALYKAGSTKWGYLPDGRVFFCPTVPVLYEVHFSTTPPSDYKTFHGTYTWHYRRINLADDPSPHLNNSSLAGVNPASRDLVYIDGRWGMWEGWGYPYRYRHYNALMVSGAVERLGYSDQEIEQWLWLD